MRSTFKKIDSHVSPRCCAWLETFANCVQTRDYETAKCLFLEDSLCYGTVMESTHSLTDLVDLQWHKVWEATEGFAFHPDKTFILGADDDPTVVIMALWSSRTNGEVKQLRQGRCTITLVSDESKDLGFTAVHTHFSIKPDSRVSSC